MSQNPFSYGKPIDQIDKFIGRKDELHRIMSRLRNQAFESSSVVGERRMGKTSLLKILAQEQLAGVHFVFVDLQEFGEKNTPKDFWDEVLTELERAMPTPQLKKTVKQFRQTANFEPRYLKRLLRELNGAGVSIVLLLDEFEQVTRNVNFDPDFFTGLRALILHNRMALVTTSYTDLSDLCHSDEIGSSPFFNIFATIYLSSFTPYDRDILFERYWPEHRLTKQEQDYLVSLAGLAPYYLQVAGNFLYESYQNLSAADRLPYLKKQFTDQVEPMLRYSWEHTNDNEKISLLVLALLKLSERPETWQGMNKSELIKYYQNAGYTLDKLAQRGLVVEQDGEYVIFSTVFAEWIRRELLEGQVAPQDYQRWLKIGRHKRLALVAGQCINYPCSLRIIIAI